MPPDHRVRGSGMHIAVRPSRTLTGVLSCDAIVGDLERRCMQRINVGSRSRMVCVVPRRVDPARSATGAVGLVQRIGAGRCFAQGPRRACGNFSRIAVTVFQRSCSYWASSSETVATPCPRQSSSLVLGLITSMMTVPCV